MKEEILDWLKATDTLTQLEEYVSLRSRSNFPEEVVECAQYSRQLLQDAGLEVELIPTSGNPLILAHSVSVPSNPTILFYGHYDVQSEGDLESWDTPPFEAVRKGDKLFGRGTADNKGQHLAHIKAIQYINQHHPEIFQSLNIKFILDGDEERGSFSMAEVFEKRSSDFKADLYIVSDGPALVSDRPTIVGSVRGILTFQITIQHNPEDLHSGNFGGLGRAATTDMINLLSSMIDDKGYAKIPGFYDEVKEPTEFEATQLEGLGPVLAQIQKEKGYSPALTKNRSHAAQNMVWPTLNINGIHAGGVKKHRRTIIPAEVVASLDSRLVPNMTSDDIKRKIQHFVQEWAVRNGCEEALTISFEHAMESVPSVFDHPDLDLVKSAFAHGFESEPLLVPRLGGSLPLYLFPEYLDSSVFLIPLALPDENNHAPNENLDIPYFRKGVLSSVKLLELFSQKSS